MTIQKKGEKELQEKYRERIRRMIEGDDWGFPEAIITYEQFKFEQEHFN